MRSILIRVRERESENEPALDGEKKRWREFGALRLTRRMEYWEIREKGKEPRREGERAGSALNEKEKKRPFHNVVIIIIACGCM